MNRPPDTGSKKDFADPGAKCLAARIREMHIVSNKTIAAAELIPNVFESGLDSAFRSD
jgi:hypothetical protein